MLICSCRRANSQKECASEHSSLTFLEVADGQNSGNATILLAAIPPGLLRCRIFVLPHVYKAIWTTRIMFTQTVCIYGETAFRVSMDIKLLDKTWIYCQFFKLLAWNFCRVALTEMTNMQRAQSEKSWVAPQYVNNKHTTKIWFYGAKSNYFQRPEFSTG